MEALRIELEGTNIGTSVFCPGGVSTDNLPPRFASAGARTRRQAAANLLLWRGPDEPAEAGER